MKAEKQEEPYRCEHVQDGSLCKKCSSNKTCGKANEQSCTDVKCPLWQYRREYEVTE